MLLDESVTPGYTTVFEVLGLPRWFPPPRRNAVKFSSPGAACHAGGNNAVQPDKKLKKDALETYGMYDVERIKYQAVRHWLGTSIFQHLSASFSPKAWQVTNGKNAMPAFGERLGPDDIEAPLRAPRAFHSFTVASEWGFPVHGFWESMIIARIPSILLQ